MKKIPLTQGQVAIVDDSDYELLSQHKWYAHKSGKTFYAERFFQKKTYSMHRIIMKVPSEKEVDHKNGNGLDNRKDNLRLCTRAENCRNKRSTNKSSRYLGVSWNAKDKRFRAQTEKDGIRYYLGQFMNEEDAAKTYDAKVNELFGSFARLNFPVRTSEL
jgi:hypothetical protein